METYYKAQTFSCPIWMLWINKILLLNKKNPPDCWFMTERRAGSGSTFFKECRDRQRGQQPLILTRYDPSWDMNKPDSSTSLHPGCLVYESSNSLAGGGDADCSMEGQSSEVTAQMCWDEGPQPDREFNDVVYLSLICRGRERDAYSGLLFVLTHRGARAERERGSICADHWTQMMKVLMHMINTTAVHKKDLQFTAYDGPGCCWPPAGRPQDVGFTCGLSQQRRGRKALFLNGRWRQFN